MRKKPPGKLLSKTAHKVEREYRIMHALENTDVAVPKTYCLCEDDSIIGTPFYIMEYLDGRIFEDFTMPGVEPAEREAMWRDAVVTLARFHAVDYKKVGLEKFGKPSGFYPRQINTWVTICGSQEKAVDIETKEPVGKLPYFEETVRFFKNERLQPKDRATLVHGDYKIDNLVFHKTEPRVIGILEYVPPCLFSYYLLIGILAGRCLLSAIRSRMFAISLPTSTRPNRLAQRPTTHLASSLAQRPAFRNPSRSWSGTRRRVGTTLGRRCRGVCLSASGSWRAYARGSQRGTRSGRRAVRRRDSMPRREDLWLNSRGH
jgi:hypothetical protein